VEVHGIIEDQLELQCGMSEGHMGNKGLPGIEHLTLPLRRVEPGELSLDPDACAGDRGSSFFLDINDIDASLQFLTDMRPVNITEIVVLIKVQQQLSIS
jgi:hypothetical protein